MNWREFFDYVDHAQRSSWQEVPFNPRPNRNHDYGVWRQGEWISVEKEREEEREESLRRALMTGFDRYVTFDARPCGQIVQEIPTPMLEDLI